MPANLTEHREPLTGMILELQANRAAVKRLRDWYGVFVFTGGDVPSGRYDLLATTSYLKRPFATDRICVGEVERYRRLIESIMVPGVAVPRGPKTLRCRMQIAAAFEETASQITTLERDLESAFSIRGESVSP